MAGTRRSDFTQAMKREMYDYLLEWEGYQEIQPVWEQLFDVMPSSAAYEQFDSAIGLGDLLEKPEGEDLVADAPMESYTIYCKNRTFGRQVRFTMESVEDNVRFGDTLRTFVQTWAKSLVRTKDRFYVKFFNKGALTAGHDVFNNTITGVVTDASGDLIYDGYPFFDTTHPDRVGNSYANHATAALSHDNLQTYWLTFTSTNNRDERGNEIELMPRVLVIPPALQFTARRILNTTQIPGSADNDINVLSGIIDPLVWQRLDDSDGWTMGVPKMGLIATDRITPVYDFYQDDTNLDYYATVWYRFGGCVTNWRFWMQLNTSTT